MAVLAEAAQELRCRAVDNLQNTALGLESVQNYLTLMHNGQPDRALPSFLRSSFDNLVEYHPDNAELVIQKWKEQYYTYMLKPTSYADNPRHCSGVAYCAAQHSDPVSAYQRLLRGRWQPAVAVCHRNCCGEYQQAVA